MKFLNFLRKLFTCKSTQVEPVEFNSTPDVSVLGVFNLYDKLIADAKLYGYPLDGHHLYVNETDYDMTKFREFFKHIECQYPALHVNSYLVTEKSIFDEDSQDAIPYSSYNTRVDMEVPTKMIFLNISYGEGNNVTLQNDKDLHVLTTESSLRCLADVVEAIKRNQDVLEVKLVDVEQFVFSETNMFQLLITLK